MKNNIKNIISFIINLMIKFKNIIPIKYRKKIKSIYQRIFIKKNLNDSIPLDILDEWNIWDTKNRKDDSFDIINFSVIPWNWRYQRPQHLAKYLANNGNRIFYIKNEFFSSKINNSFAPILVEKIDNNIYEITLSASKNIFIYSDKPTQKDIDIILSSLKNLINKANIINPVAKFDHPFWEYIHQQISMPIIYDCMDNHVKFHGTSSNISQLEKSLIKNADLVLASSNYLHKKMSYLRKDVLMLKNAGDFSHFNLNNKKLPLPDDIKLISHPIIGYYGAIAEWMDEKIIENIAKNNPDKSLVLIGRIMNQQIETLSQKYPNIHLLGEKTYQELPNYLSQFDVAIIPFKISDLIKATHPVKIFEYFAAEKPVVSTFLPELEDIKDLIYFSNENNFSENINKALKSNNKLLIAKAKEYSKKNTWENRGLVLKDKIERLLFPKVSVILLSYNLADLVKNAIDSIIERSFYPNFELIIVDNKSDDETIKTLKKYQNTKNIKIIFNDQNYGFAKGNNIGLHQAKGDYLILLNNDVMVTPGWISRLLFYCRQKQVGLVGVVTNNISNEAKVEISYDFDDRNQFEKTTKTYTSQHWGKIIPLNNIAAFCWMESRNTYKKIGDLDERFGIGMFEDDDYCHRIRNNNQLIFCAEDVFIHHYGQSSFKKLSFEKYMEIFNENKLKYEKKWHITWEQHKFRKETIFKKIIKKIYSIQKNSI